MSSTNPVSDMEKWHDYQVDSQLEIVRLLDAACDSDNVLTIAIDDSDDDVAVTQILSIDAEKNEVIIDRPKSEEQIERIMQSPKVFCETSLHKVRLLFSVEYIDECEYQRRPAFSFSVPHNLIRLQRREWFRVEPPTIDAVRCRVLMPKNLGAGVCVLPVHDLSGGGVALIDEGHVMKAVLGRLYPDCTLILPESTLINTALEVRNLNTVDHCDKDSVLRVGCSFHRMPPALLDKLQRYIFKLEAVHW